MEIPTTMVSLKASGSKTVTSFLSVLTVFMVSSIFILGSRRVHEDSLARARGRRQLTQHENPRGVVVASAFDHVTDSQRPGVKFDAAGEMDTFYQSVLRHKVLSAIIVSNMFDEAFRKRKTTPQVRFIHLDAAHHYSFGGYEHMLNRSLCDQRYVIYNWLIAHNDFAGFDYILSMDLTDSEVLHNPFPYMKSIDLATGKHQIFVSSESASGMAWGWLNGWNCFNGQYYFTEGNSKFYNVAIAGGHISVYKEFVHELVRLEREVKVHSANVLCDMAFGNRVLKDYFNGEVMTGYPFHTKFRGDERDSSAYIRHK